MNPNEAIRNILANAHTVLNNGGWNENAEDADLAQQIIDLVAWLANGGAAPDWQTAVGR